MRRVEPDTWSGLVMLLVSVAVGGPVLFGAVDPAIPRAWWAVIFIVMIAAILVVSASEQRTRVRDVGLTVAVLGSWAVLLTAPGMGYLSILLVLIAALSVYVSRLTVTWTIVGLNSVVLAAGAAAQANAPAHIVLGTGIYLLIQLAAVLSSVAIIREQRMRRQLTEAHVELRAASVLLSESARTAERLRISRDLHDSIGHQLTVLSLELEAARHRDGEHAREHVERANTVARELLGDVRTTVGELRTEASDLTASLTRMATGLPGLEVTVDVDPDVRVGEEEQAALVRAVQEVVTNTIRHAQARELWIDVRRDADGTTVLNAADDGRGAPEPALGNGLRGMIERFEALGGDVRLDGRKGFRITARVPAT